MKESFSTIVQKIPFTPRVHNFTPLINAVYYFIVEEYNNSPPSALFACVETNELQNPEKKKAAHKNDQR